MICSANTNIGMKRNVNQDTFVIKKYTEKTCLAVVCDGMGGAKGGEEASKLAANTFVRCVDEFITPYIGNKEKSFRASDVIRMMTQALEEANERVYMKSIETPSLNGMGTTIVAALLIDKTVFCLNVGDSRMYFLKGNKIKQITKDHSYVQYLVDMGRMSEEEAESSFNKNIITRAVGTEEDVDGDMYKESVNEGTFILLCSDGLSNFVDNATMCDIVSSDAQAKKLDQVELDLRIRKLIDTANVNGGADNITVAIIKV